MRTTPFTTLQDVADFLRTMDNGPDAECGFDMRRMDSYRDSTDHPCGSACCIGGWVNLVNHPKHRIGIVSAVHELAPEIDQSECFNLCWPDHDHAAYDATPQQAARAIEILLETGECDWDRAMGEVQ